MNLSTQGNYTAIRGGLPLGRTDEGFFIEINHKGEIHRFEEFSQNAIDMIKMGADVFVEGVLKEWNAVGLLPALWYHSADFGNMDCPAGQFAVRDGCAQPLILTASNCSPAFTDGPATFTFHSTIMEPEVAARINLNNKPRTVPIRFRVFLTNIGNEINPIYSYFSIA